MSSVIERIGLEGYRVLGMKSTRDVEITAEPEKAPTACPCCGAARLRSKGRYNRTVRHLNCFSIRSTLHVNCHRYRCMACERTFVERLPGIMPYRRTSEPLRPIIYQRHQDGIPASILAASEGIGDATIERIYEQFTVRKAAERLSRICPQILGIDEHTLHKKERYVTTLCDLRRHRVFDIVEGKSEADLEGFLSRLKGRDKVRIVCMDLSSSYRSIARKYFPNAMIVADRFQVVRVAMHHLLAIARKLIPDLARMNTRRVMRLLATRPDRLEERLKHELGRLFGKAPALKAVYDKLQQVCSILRAKDQNKTQCKRLIERLLHTIDELRQSGLKPAQTLARTLSDWREEIVRVWRFSRSNGITKGFHRKMKLIQRRAYGFRSFQNYRLRVIAQCG